MQKFQLRKPVLAAMGACAALCASPGIVLADNASDIQALKDQMRQMQQKIDQLSTTPSTPASAAPAPAKKSDSGALKIGRAHV